MGGNLTVHEVNVISGALELTTKTARRSMTPMSKVGVQAPCCLSRAGCGDVGLS